MNRILIVGHSSTPYPDIEKSLRECGMAPALPSRKEGFSPSEIGATLLKAHSAKKSDLSVSSRGLEQLHPAPIWQGLALDLMLGNIGQEFWGWSDPNAVYLLDYWRRLDPDLKFVLVFGEPCAVLEQGTGSEFVSTNVSQLLREWQAFNESILDFYNRNADCCVLVHAQQAQLSVKAYLQQVRTRLDAPLVEPADLALPSPNSSDFNENIELGGGESAPGESLSLTSITKIGDDVLSKYLARQLLAEHPAVIDLYEELQAVASLPLDEIEEVDNYSVESAWREVNVHRQIQKELLWSLSEKQRYLTDELAATQAQLHVIRADKDSLQASASKLQDALTQAHHDYQLQQASFDSRERELAEEKQFLLSQSNVLQEELARFHVQKKEHDKELDVLKEEEKRKVSVLTSEISRLASDTKEQGENLRLLRAHAQTLERTTNELTSDKEFLLSQLHSVQEAFEDIFMENRRLKDEERRRNPPLYGAANRIKRQLTYRLGATMVSHSKNFSGWVSMPFALLRTRREFQRDRASMGSTKLPPIFKYLDADEAGRVKQHLSYMLGEAMMNNSRTLAGWLRMPFALRRAVKDFERIKLNR